ncbi:manganese efflux pump MntP family protein [bacterium]|nr:manganese efflux pump MntP family protein [bacterium]
MNIYEIIGIALGLSMDAFAVCIACSITLKRVSARQIFRFSFHFGFFQALMPVIGWLAGMSAHRLISGWDHWVAFGLLTFVGLKAIYESRKEKEKDLDIKDPTKGLSLVIFSIATSIDALAVGLSLSALNVNIIKPALIIGCITGSLSIFGMILGNKIGSLFGRYIEFLGGLILIGIGLKILISHIF